MRVVHTVNSLRADHGGPSRSVTALCTHLARQGAAVELAAYRADPAAPPPVLPADDRVGVHFAPPEPGWRPFVGSGTSLGAVIASAAQRGAVVHDHGLWLPSNHASVQTAQRLGLPYVVSTRGMLTQWALDQGRLKKKLAWALYQHRDLAAARMLHATADEEVEDIRRAGLRNPVVVLPNGVEVPDEARTAPSDGLRRALFVSRVHPKKGLLNLVEAWAEVRPEGWEMVIAGPDEDGHRAEVEAHARQHGVEALRWVGEVDDDAKWDLYRSADLFVLPTFSENFGIVVAEALAVGVPAITTTGAPWSVLNERGCGWWIDIGVEPLAAALREAVALGDEDRLAMGVRGRTYVEADLSWERVATEMLAAYRWLRGEGERPAAVVID